MGDLDWGPVIGGYIGAMLLASAYSRSACAFRGHGQSGLSR